MKKHAWVITEDHLYDGDFFDTNEAGTTGPHDANEDVLEAFELDKFPKSLKRFKFHIYDDDGILYYAGWLGTSDDIPDDDALMAPLYDFGGPNAGAVLIKYENHPNWTIEY